MIDYKTAKMSIKKSHPNDVITSSFETPTLYVFALKPKDIESDVVLIDPFFSIDKRTGKEKEYSPVFDLDNYKKAMKSGMIKDR